MSRMFRWNHAHIHDDCHDNGHWLVVRQELPTLDFVKVGEESVIVKMVCKLQWMVSAVKKVQW